MKRYQRFKDFHYPCRHCGKNHDSAFMADVCFQLDMKILKAKEDKQKDQDINLIKTKT